MNSKLFEYIENGLKKDGLDGLCNEDLECGCGVEDLMTCQDTNYCDEFPNCEPAKRVIKGSKECGDCEVDDCHGHCFKTPQNIEEILKEVQP